MPTNDRNQLLDNPIETYPATTVACFDATTGGSPRRQLDSRRNQMFLQKLADLNVEAVLIAASTGHGHVRTAAELEHWFRSSAGAQLGTTLKMALLRPEDGRETNRRLLNVLCDLDYQVVFVRPGMDLALTATSEQIASNMRPIVEDAARVGLAVGVYSVPDVSGVALPVDATVNLLDGTGGEHIVAVKVTESNFDASTLCYLRHPRLSHLKIVQGWDPFLARALQEGPKHDPRSRQRCGVTSGPMSFAVHQYAHIFEAARREDWSEVNEAQNAVTAIFRSMQDDPAKFADLQRAKYIMGLGKPVMGDVSEDQVARVFQALESLTRDEDRQRLAKSLDLMEDGPYHDRLNDIAG